MPCVPLVPRWTGGGRTVPEVAEIAAFRDDIMELARSGQLARVFIDEAHVFVFDHAWRSSLNGIHWISQLPCRRVLMTGTLPLDKVPALAEQLALQHSNIYEIRSPQTPARIRRSVRTYNSSADWAGI